MEVKLSNEQKSWIVTLKGDIAGIDVVRLGRTVDRLRHHKECRRLYIDLNEVTYIDSVGLGGLLYAHTVFQRVGKETILVGPTKRIHDLFRDCHLDGIFQIVDSIGDDTPIAEA